MLERILDINSKVNNLVWGWPMLILLVGTGILYSVYLGFPQIRRFGYAMKNTLFKIFDKSDDEKEGDVSAFQAVSTALAATVGTGNIAGVATAIVLGGPGAVFWMWLSAFFGMATKLTEVALAVTYRESNKDGSFSGGPMYYIKNGLKLPWLAGIFAFFGMLASFGIGNMTQANSIAGALNGAFGFNKMVVGIVVSVLAATVIIGGIKRIGKFTEKLVPFMAALYILGAIFILVMNITSIPAAFAMIFKSAFTPEAAGGGAVGITLMLSMRYGIARGVFTNEAGLGSAPIAHAAAKTDHPMRQGMWGIFEVFIDTIVICTMTALVIIISGLFDSGLEGAELTVSAFEFGFNGGQYIVSTGLTLFAFSTILGWAYYGEKCSQYLFGDKAVWVYRIVYIPFIIIGSIGGLTEIWKIADTLNGLMAIPNLIGLILLLPVVKVLYDDFFKDPDRIRTDSREYLDILPEKFKVK